MKSRDLTGFGAAHCGKYRWPAIYVQKEFIDEGGLMSYGADLR